MWAIRTTTISILALGLLAGSAVGIAAQDEPNMDWAEMTGQSSLITDIPGGTFEETPDLVAGDDNTFLQLWSTSDPRLDGDVTTTVNFRFDPNSFTGIDVAAYELTNDGGSWLGDGRAFSGGSVGNVVSIALIGHDGYEGLSALVVMESTGEGTWDLSGVISPTAMPDVPEPYAGE